jgi:DNA-binding beta-propeller fold protein YncE
MKKLLAPLALAALLAAGCSEEKICRADETKVNGTCYALRSDPKNCGTVGHACGSTESCQSGACVDCLASPGACAPAVVAACFNLNQVRPLTQDLVAAMPPLATDGGPISIAALGNSLYVANSLSNSLSAVTLSPPAATSGAASIKIPSAGTDLEHVAAHGGFLWVSNAANGTLVVVDPARGPIDEIALPPGGPFGPNPQGIDFVGDKGYLALQALNAVAVIDASKVPGVTLRSALIDLTPLAASGATALPSRVLASAARVYVTLNDLDASFNPVAGANGRLAVIDAATDKVVGSAVDLGVSCLNPGGMALSGSTLWIACGFHVFDSTAVKGGALVPVDVSGATPVVGTPILLADHAAFSIAFCDGRGYAGATESGTVIAFDPVSRTVSATALVCPAEKASAVPGLACAP